MKSFVTERPRVERGTPGETHDLPVLGATEAPPSLTPWESLMDDGVQPALVLGAERRSSGVRRP